LKYQQFSKLTPPGFFEQNLPKISCAGAAMADVARRRPDFLFWAGHYEEYCLPVSSSKSLIFQCFEMLVPLAIFAHKPPNYNGSLEHTPDGAAFAENALTKAFPSRARIAQEMEIRNTPRTRLHAFCTFFCACSCTVLQVAARFYEIGPLRQPPKPPDNWTFAGFLVSPSVGHPSPTRGCYLEG
jgi:hypothetical protein